jgi:hypothetical protein
VINLVAWLLIELCGASSFRVREAATVCLQQLHKWDEQRIAWPYLSLDTRLFNWAAAHKDPEIRARVASLLRDKEHLRWHCCWVYDDEHIRILERDCHMKFRYRLGDPDSATGRVLVLFERRLTKGENHAPRSYLSR